jgi:alpha-glucosidase
MGLLLTYPGVPSIFMGDEIGLKGAWGEDARRTINWNRVGWDEEFLESVKQLVAIRRNSHALAEGGLRWIAIEDDLVGYIRESKREKLLVVVTRTGGRFELPEFSVHEKLFGPSFKGRVFETGSAAVGIYRLS